tara:strand:- start:914 stop:1672 length:759 start_codon:yes stop_codon:yes gene_type:complete
MSINVFQKDNQTNGNFNNGEILEKKPIGFPQDGGKLKPYSNIFYWAHAWAPLNDSIIGLHPHRGFEICSFVLKGEIEHYDTLLDKWITLSKGDVQIIKAGKGISHSEKLNKGSEIFQIWFDPNIQESLYIDASYNDFRSKDFKIKSQNNVESKIIQTNENQLYLKSKGIEIYEHKFNNGIHSHKIKNKCYHSFFILSGTLEINNQEFTKGDFLIIDNEKNLELVTKNYTKVFEIVSLINLTYKTYAEIHKIN